VSRDAPQRYPRQSRHTERPPRQRGRLGVNCGRVTC